MCVGLNNPLIFPNMLKDEQVLSWGLLTLSMGVGLKLPHFVRQLCDQKGRPYPDVFKKVWYLYVILLVIEMVLLTLFMGVGFK